MSGECSLAIRPAAPGSWNWRRLWDTPYHKLRRFRAILYPDGMLTRAAEQVSWIQHYCMFYFPDIEVNRHISIDGICLVSHENEIIGYKDDSETTYFPGEILRTQYSWSIHASTCGIPDYQGLDWQIPHGPKSQHEVILSTRREDRRRRKAQSWSQKRASRRDGDSGEEILFDIRRIR